MKIGIILNFNNYQNTYKSANNLLSSGIERIVIVDNNSKNKSFEFLTSIFQDDKKIDVIQSTKNEGYASGNNIGLRFAERKYGLNNIIFIVNPDVIANKKIISKISSLINGNDKVGIVTAKVNDTMKSAWKHTGLIRGFVFNCWFINAFLYKLGIIERKGYKLSSNRLQPVDVISGAFFGIKQTTFKKIGYFDEGTFLYYEEEILYCKLANINKQNYLINNIGYSHFGQTSTKFNRLKLKKISDKSRLYYQINYNKAGKLYQHLYKGINSFDDFILKLFIKE